MALHISATQAAEPAQGEIISPKAKLAAKAFQLPEGFTLTTVASEPQTANGVAFCFDPKGRIFIAETYRVKKGIEDNREHMNWLDDDLAAQSVADRREYVKRRMGDKIGDYTKESEVVRLLEDRDGDGTYESSSVFSTDYKNIEDGTAAGVYWCNDRLLFACIPALWELRDDDHDGKAEKRRALATGFGVHFALYGHDLHGFCTGPDGKVYVSIGDRGLNVETPAGRLFNPNSGAVLRFNPDGSDLELFATGLRNPQELAFNEFGDLFTVDNNSDSGDQARLVHIVEGMEVGWRMSFQYLDDRGPFNREKIWKPQNADQPASIVPPLANIAKGPSGLTYYPGTGLPAAYNGAFFLVDFLGGATNSGIREFHVEQAGATYKLTDYKPFLTGVLATDCDFGPSGDMYILDWVEGWNGPGVGRTHRLVCDDAK
jgi:quinoprotein glucose dehydrogenase